MDLWIVKMPILCTDSQILRTFSQNQLFTNLLWHPQWNCHISRTRCPISNIFAPKLNWKNSNLGNSKKAILIFWPNWFLSICWVTYDDCNKTVQQHFKKNCCLHSACFYSANTQPFSSTIFHNAGDPDHQQTPLFLHSMKRRVSSTTEIRLGMLNQFWVTLQCRLIQFCKPALASVSTGSVIH